MLLSATNLRITRSGAVRLDLPDVHITTGEALLLLGPSGSGKTTLLSVLAGLLPPTQGKVMFETCDLYALSASARDKLRGQKFGFIFQTLHFLPSLTLRQNILLAQDMSGQKAEAGRIDKLLEDLGLADKAHRKPDALSQGELQRGAIARAVLLKPSIILADEPTSALDDHNAELVINLLKTQAKESGSALLVATHDNRLFGKLDRTIQLHTQAQKEAA